jgi:hypothetical protein
MKGCGSYALVASLFPTTVSLQVNSSTFWSSRSLFPSVVHPETRRAGSCRLATVSHGERSVMIGRSSWPQLSSCHALPCSLDIPAGASYKYLACLGTTPSDTFLSRHDRKITQSSRPLAPIGLREWEHHFQPGPIRFGRCTLVYGSRWICYRYVGQVQTLRLEHGSPKR